MNRREFIGAVVGVVGLAPVVTAVEIVEQFNPKMGYPLAIVDGCMPYLKN